MPAARVRGNTSSSRNQDEEPVHHTRVCTRTEPMRKRPNKPDGLPGRIKDSGDQVRSKRSAFITLVQAATKSCTNLTLLSSWAYTSA